MLHQAVTVVALELLRRRVRRRHRAPAGGRRAGRRGLRRAGGRRARAAAGAVRPRATASAVLVLTPPRSRPRRSSRARSAAALRDEAAGGLVAGTGDVHLRAAPARRAATTSCSSSPGACALRVVARGAARARGRRGPRGARRRRAARPSTRRAARSRRATLGRRRGQRQRATAAATARDLQRPGLLPAAALAAGRRGAAAVLRLDPRPDRGRRGPLRRRADALAGGVHRVQRAVGARPRGGSTATATRCATGSAGSRS